MSDTDCEIEFLDEDAEVVQKCVTSTLKLNSVEDYEEKLPTLLIERPPKKRKAENNQSQNDDSATDFKPSAKRKTYSRLSKSVPSSQKSKVQIVQKSKPKIDPKILSLRELQARKRMNLRIPDYEDPLCMPVKPNRSKLDDKNLDRWNQLCIDHMRHADTVLQFDKGHVTSSQRNIVLRNVGKSGKTDVHVWSKTTVMSNFKQKKSEIFQSLLPSYREKKQLSFPCSQKAVKPFCFKEEVVLTKESHKDGDVLVIYKPKENLSAVYKLENDSDLENEEEDNGPMLRGARELTCTRMCARCYQTSWRGFKKTNNDSTVCPICKLSLVSVYNLLAHLRCSHLPSDVRKYRKQISNTLAKTVGYHYKCRICQENLIGITELRKHISTHKGTEEFFCEISSHLTQ